MNLIFRGLAVGSAIAVIALGTSACGLEPDPGASTDDPVVSATPTAEPAAASGDRPQPRVDASCSDFATPALLDPLFARPVAVAPPTRTAEYIGARIADQWTVRQDGGFACEWSNVDATVTSEGMYDYDGLRLLLLPASGPQWQAYSDDAGDGSDRRLECNDYDPSCSLDQYLPNGWWLQLVADNLDAGAAFTPASLRALSAPVFASIVSAVSALPAPDPAWSFPTPDDAFGGGCTGIISGAQLASALGISPAAVSDESTYPYIGRAALLDVGGSECRWAESSGFYDLANIQVLPGGAWAQAEAKAAMEALIGASVPSPAVPGVPAGATALYEHVDSVALDLVLGGTWIKVSVWNGSATIPMSPQDALIAVGTEIAAG